MQAGGRILAQFEVKVGGGGHVSYVCAPESGWGSRIQMGIPNFEAARLPVSKAGNRLCVLQTGVTATSGCLPDWQPSRHAATSEKVDLAASETP